MASWSNATVTEKGYALQAKLVSTNPLVITKVVSGSGRVTAGQLVNQTAVSEEKQTLTVEALSYDSNGNAIIKTSLNNKELTSGYICNQIGIYASDPDEGEILYAIAQEAAAGEEIPSITEQPNGFYCSWVFSLTFSNSSNVSVTIDSANALTKDAADAFYSAINHNHHDIYYTEAETDEKLAKKSDKKHTHSVSDLTDILPLEKGGTGANTESGARKNLKIAGRACEGESKTIFGQTYVGGIGAEIFNDPTYNVATGDYSHAEGVGTGAIGAASHSEGQGTMAKGKASHASGYYTQAGDYQFATGKHNSPATAPSGTDEQSADSSIFMIGYGTSATKANAFRVSSAGKCYGSASFIGSGADFPEFEEWADGNPDNEDRRGLFVALDGDKIVLASSEKDHIIGVVSAMGAFIANGASENWRGMYLKDVFGENLTQQVEVPEKTIEKKVVVKDEAGNEIEKTRTEVIPAHIVTQFVINPDYNPEEEYIGREFRKEWAPIGKLGQVIVVDDGTCTVGGYCKPSANGIGTAGEYGYYVRKRIDSTHIKVEISPGAFNK